MKILGTTLITISFALQIFGQCLETEQMFKNYFKKNISSLDPIEGIWSANQTTKIYDQYNSLVSNKYNPQAAQVAIISDVNNFKICNFSNKDDISIIVISKTASNGLYLYQNTFPGSYAVAKANAKISEEGLLEYSYEIPEEEIKYEAKLSHLNYVKYTVIIEIKMIKLFPSITEIQNASPSSGTGFAITSNGLIVTNHHVTNGATKIKVRGIGGDFNKTYNAKLIIEDKNNDLTLIQIDDLSFTSLGIIPYIINNKTSDVGTSIFVLGYPLRASMGDEIKLTNGIISSKSGFQGDVTTYQMSAPVQPGNSGGPMFDEKGNVIGIVNAKHLGAENASYAIKSIYLLNLIDLITPSPVLQIKSAITEKTLSEQVKIVKKYTYIVEVNQ